MRSKETLYHFRCPDCDKWWSIADAPADRNRWFCPWCGESFDIQAEDE